MDEQLKSNVKLVFIILALVLCLYLVKLLFPVITLVIVSLLVVYLLAPVVTFLVQFRVPRPIAAVTVFALLLFIIFLLFYYIPPMIFREIRQLAGYIAVDFRHWMEHLFEQLYQIDLLYDLELTEAVTEAATSFVERLPSLLMNWVGEVSAEDLLLLGELWSLAGLFFLVFFLLLDFERVKTNLVRHVPPHYREEALNVINIVDEKVGAFIRGNIIRCTIVGVATGFGLSFLDMPFAIILGIVAGILNIIPNIGPVLASIPAIILSFAPQTPHPLMVLVLYLIIQTVDPFILTPYLLGRAVDLRPLTVVIAILAGAKLMGFLGIILSIPVAAIIKVLIMQYYVSKIESTAEYSTAEEKGRGENTAGQEEHEGQGGKPALDPPSGDDKGL